ncbi:hypothetical protein ABZ721_05275 [Streptomyces sp. NPDC006733]|uniref:hypothetical protein n=1 Tax=Streptomyces sp. NPDC006733 TaxID=3155460 RepID=UPI0033DB5F6C
MGQDRGRHFVPRDHIDGLGLGTAHGSHPIAGLAGGLAQVGRRLLVGLAVAAMALLIYRQPSNALVKGVVTSGVVLALYTLRLVWRRVSAAFGLCRCYLFADGLLVTNLFGGTRAVVRWSEVSSLHRMVSQSLLMSFHRVEIVRRGSATLAFLALGAEPALVPALLGEATRNGIS